VNISMRLTVDGLIRSLKGFVHDLADELEHSGRETVRRGASGRPAAKSEFTRPAERLPDERRG
jgi:hypothetical protein